MPAFAAAIDALFADPNLALDGVYRAGGTDPGVPVRVILRRPDRIVEYGETRIVSESVSIDIRTREVAAPRAGDGIDVDGTIYVIQGEPIRDPERLVWTINARPQGGQADSCQRHCQPRRQPRLVGPATRSASPRRSSPAGGAQGPRVRTAGKFQPLPRQHPFGYYLALEPQQGSGGPLQASASRILSWSALYDHVTPWRRGR